MESEPRSPPRGWAVTRSGKAPSRSVLAAAVEEVFWGQARLASLWGRAPSCLWAERSLKQQEAGSAGTRSGWLIPSELGNHLSQVKQRVFNLVRRMGWLEAFGCEWLCLDCVCQAVQGTRPQRETRQWPIFGSAPSGSGAAALGRLRTGDLPWRPTWQGLDSLWLHKRKL